MVIVVGSPVLLPAGRSRPARAGGGAAEIALAATGAGAHVELIGKVGDDPAGDAIAVELERAGVGHAALLRDPSTATPLGGRGAPLRLSRPDLELALRYLGEARVIVVADPVDMDGGEAIAEAARYGGAHLVLIGDDRDATGKDAGTVTVLVAPPGESGPFAEFVGRYAASLDAGRSAADAFAAATDDVGWQPAGGA